MPWIAWIALSLFIGCGKPSTPPANGEAATSPTETPAVADDDDADDDADDDDDDDDDDADDDDDDDAPKAAAEVTPASLYAECRDRVEQPEAAGECTSDADCAAAGCSSEICTTKKAGADVMSTCEVRGCYAVLDACGCVEGRCAWSLKDVVPERKPLEKMPL